MVTLDHILQARRRLASWLDPTPTLRIADPSRFRGLDVRLKAENLQRTGSFKIRGAYNRISHLVSAGEGGRSCPGVITASAGNHAQGVALAARMAGMPATIVMPEETPIIKVERTKGYGARVLMVGHSFEEADQHARELGQRQGLTFVHPFEDLQVIAGQGTIGLEILEEFSDVQTVLVPVGGGGLIAGIGTAIKSVRPQVRVIGVQARGAAAAVVAFKEGRVVSLEQAETIADAIRMKRVSPVTLAIMRQVVDDMVEVGDEEISEAMVCLLEETRLVVEAAGAVGMAALLAGRLPSDSERTCVVLSGGNIDLNLMARVVEQGLTRSRRYLRICTQIPDKPGQLFRLLQHLAERKINVLDVQHHRAGWRVPLIWAEVELVVETRDAAHGQEIMESLASAGYRIECPQGSALPPANPGLQQ